MKNTCLLLCALQIGLLSTAAIHAKELGELSLLYIGKERTSHYVDFLKANVAHVETRDRGEFDLAAADSFDVVLLDWPQSGKISEKAKVMSPLGERSAWHTPTVLLGSAGLNLAVSWKLQGGSGCTCLDPLAYDIRKHEIFERPFMIDRNKMISIPTPRYFRGEIDAQEIKVLALVDEVDKNRYPGWCTYSRDFARHPDVEFFCGGVNSKTPKAAGLWRQGNLLHFGFDLSPTEMSESGRQILLNAIVYISRFTQDRPIAITPSVFAGPVARPRSTLARWLRDPDYPTDFAKELVAPEIWERLSALSDREKMAQWADENAQFLHPNSDLKLTFDEDLLVLGIPQCHCRV